jgi:hypothetical protein
MYQNDRGLDLVASAIAEALQVACILGLDSNWALLVLCTLDFL